MPLQPHQAVEHALSVLFRNARPAVADRQPDRVVLRAQVDVDRAVGPVSYTHLDVYKRQLELLLGVSASFLAFAASAQSEPCLLYTSRCV